MTDRSTSRWWVLLTLATLLLLLALIDLRQQVDALLAGTAEIVSINPALPGDVVFRVVARRWHRRRPRGRARRRGRARFRGAARRPTRGQALHAAADALDADAASLADLICREVGKPITEARGEMARAVAIMRFYAQVCLDPEGESYPSADARSLLVTRRAPRGVVGLITPWNFPMAIPVWKLAPALAYGNACVWKPSQLSPACAQRLHELLAPRLPEDVVQLVQGEGDTGAALVAHGRVAALSFTGSRAGRPGGRRPAGRARRRRPVRDGRAERRHRAGRRRRRGRRRDDRVRPRWATPARSAPPPAG